MKDKYSRKITYLRLSLTDKCNLRCKYCVVAEDKNVKENDTFSYHDKITAVSAAARIGISKVRLTGGEPLCYPDLIKIIFDIRRIDNIKEVYLTTNGTMLSQVASELKKAGLDGINISLDTLDRQKYKLLTGFDMFDKVFQNIEKVITLGFRKIKINVVLIGGFNDSEIRSFVDLTKSMPLDVRFIELMPIAGNDMFSQKSCIKGSEVLKICPELRKIEIKNSLSVARYYKLDNAKGRVGLIEPVFSPFCSICNRLRITYDGFVRPCLYSNDEYSLIGKNEDEMMQTIRFAVSKKPPEHANLCNFSDNADQNGWLEKSMNKIGG